VAVRPTYAGLRRSTVLAELTDDVVFITVLLFLFGV